MPCTSPLGNTGLLNVVRSPLPILLSRAVHWSASMSTLTQQEMARGVPTNGGVHGVQTNLGLGQAGDGVQRGSGVLGGGAVLGRQAVEHARQRADLGGLAVVGGRLEPGVLVVLLEVGVVGRGFALEGVQGTGFVVVVPGVLDRLGHALGEVLVVEAGDGLQVPRSPPSMKPPGKPNCVPLVSSTTSGTDR